jgi:hypothetical protein
MAALEITFNWIILIFFHLLVFGQRDCGLIINDRMNFNGYFFIRVKQKYLGKIEGLYKLIFKFDIFN